MILKSHDQKITEFSNAGDSDKSTSRFLLRLGSREMWEERKQDKKYRQLFRRSFIIKGMREMKQFLEGEMESREKWKK